MEKHIIAFGASNSKHSINKTLATYAGNQLEGINLEVLDLNDYPLPVYSIDDQRATGIPEEAVAFLLKIKESDGIIISLAEYNGLYTSAFKNLWDWLSRVESPAIWQNKPMLLLSASPARRDSNYVTKVSLELFPAFGANIIADFCLPSFNHFFKGGEIVEADYAQKFQIALQKFQAFLNSN
ncbi:MAG: NAD(P)H-dependent oxidoreductase [Cyclobacteriaceae bacterium]